MSDPSFYVETDNNINFSLTTVDPQPPVLKIMDLMEIRVVDGVLVAKYLPEDLDEAARVFVNYVNSLFGLHPLEEER
jgi:hypothetical protein